MSPLFKNPEELLPWTQYHFLRGALLITPPEAPEEPPIKSLCVIKRWNRKKTIQHIFVRRRKHEYITELPTRVRWKT